ncbi:MAG: oxidoreductase [Opitutae bacterium]|nr:oxidoreductase [Opitutae bacterium]
MIAVPGSQKVVCVTGCARGLGRALSHSFANRGWTVTGCSRSKKDLALLTEKLPSPHLFRSVDVTDDQGVQNFAQEVLDELGPPDLLLNNAGVINRNAPLTDLSDDEVSHVLNVNVKGLASCMRYFLPAMEERGKGVVVNFSSGWGRSTSPEVAPYCASKWAVEGLSQAVAGEVSSGIAVVALNPGIIDTDMLRSCFGEAASGYPDADAWVSHAVPFLEGLNASDNGRSLTAP